MIYKNLLRPILFSLEAERAHEIGSTSLRFLSKFPPILTLLRNLTQGTQKPVEAFGLQFPNAIGQAAGLDKDGLFPVASEALGFGHISKARSSDGGALLWVSGILQNRTFFIHIRQILYICIVIII